LIDIYNTIHNIEQKTSALLAQLVALKEENALLKTQNREITTHNRALQTDLLLRDSEISYLKKNNIGQEVERTEAGTQNHHLRQEIDQYITEIDKCIDWLQNQ
jgi:regulator of replication initiation timing